MRLSQGSHHVISASAPVTFGSTVAFGNITEPPDLGWTRRGFLRRKRTDRLSIGLVRGVAKQECGVHA